MAVSEKTAANELAAGLESQGVYVKPGGDGELPEGSMPKRRNAGNKANPYAASAIVAGLFHEQAQRTGDTGYLEGAMEAAEKAGDVGLPDTIDDQDVEELEGGGVIVDRTPIVPPPMTAPPVYRPLRAEAGPNEGEEGNTEVGGEEEVMALEVEEVELSPELPADLVALLTDDEAGPEDEEEEEEEETEEESEIEDTYIGQEQEFVPEGYEDEEKLALRKQVAKLQKKLAATSSQRVVSDRNRWEDEARQYFPAATPFLDTIEAESHRDFVRKAKALHDRNLPYVQKALAAEKAELEAQKAAAREEAREETRRAWGAPVTTTAPAGAVAASTMDRHHSVARMRQGLDGIMKKRIKDGEFGRL